MELLAKEEIKNLLKNKKLFIEPLLDQEQIGAVSIDLRLGYDFLVSIVTRRPSIPVMKKTEDDRRGSASFYQSTRRDIGEFFILYPNQVVLTTTLEYIALPNSIYADIITRSSYNRLGIHTNTLVQPGYRGCFNLELYNHGNNPIELVVGSRLVQARFFDVGGDHPYGSSDRKYKAVVRPIAPIMSEDKDLDRLFKCGQARNCEKQ